MNYMFLRLILVWNHLIVLLDTTVPNGDSRTWYIEEEGTPSIPKMWGKWNIIVDIENNNKMWSVKELKHVSNPQFKEFQTIMKKKILEIIIIFI